MSGNSFLTERRVLRGSWSAAFALQIQACRLWTPRNLLLLPGITVCLIASGCMQRRISSESPLWPAVVPATDNAATDDEPVDEVIVPAVKLSPHVHPEQKSEAASSFQIRGPVSYTHLTLPTKA